MPELDFRNVNSLWGSVLVETLARLGLRHAVISPGSRSTPLTVQLARHPAIEAIPVLDERSAAFFALGLARQTRRPVVLLCTSGTAGANYFPAVIEARESGVPLLVITADRPPEMRACRSGQTIDQQKLFGGYVDFFHEFAVPEASESLLAYLRQTLVQAWSRACSPGGPVHLNAPFRDPLPPLDDGSAVALRQSLTDAFFSEVAEAAAPREQRVVLRLRGRGVIIAGQARPADAATYARAVGRLARQLGWPVLADVLSPLRNFHREVPGLITTYDTIARSSLALESLSPDRILCLHEWPTSKALRQWVQKLDVPVTLVAGRSDNADALHARTRPVRAEVEDLRLSPAPRAPKTWVAAWLAAERRASSLLRRGLARSGFLFEGAVSAILPKALPAGSWVMVANSMPVRDGEYFWPANNRGHAVHGNRGANGIDGTLSTALGLAHGARPGVLLTGDLAFLHDANGLLLAKKLRGSLTVVVINNNGGGIFEHLPVAQFDPPFEEFFATPQTVDLAGLCAAHGVRHAVVRTLVQLEKSLAAPKRGLRVLEVRTDRKRDAAFRQALFAGVAQRLG